MDLRDQYCTAIVDGLEQTMAKKPLTSTELTELTQGLHKLARNLWWTWHPDVINLFRELDPILWRVTDHNPIEFLKKNLG